MPHSMDYTARSAGRTLLNELNHRIKNEFASIINVVTFNAVWTDNSDAKRELSNVVDLLHQQSEVHSLLTMPDSDALVDAGEEIRRLGLAISRCKLERMKIRSLLSIDSLPLEAERCWRLGLAVHELLANCVKHARFDDREGEIKVELTRAGSWVNCRVTDNGSGLGRIQPGRGLRIVGELTTSLGGLMDRTSGPTWNSFALAFPLTKREQRAHRALAARRPRAVRQVKNTRSVRTAAARANNSVPSLQPEV